jgi:A/G-specific adenine glycosylase
VRQVALIVRKNGQILLRQCAPGERWAGLWDLPRFETTGQGDLQIARRRLRDQSGLKASFGPKLFTLRHTVTRFQIELDCHEATRISGRLLNGSDSPWQWVKFAEIARFPLNVTARRITARVLA